MNQYVANKQEDFKKCIDFFKKEITSLRTGRANPSLLDGIQVEVYGSRTSVNGLANINVADSKTMLVVPWDKNIVKDIEKAIAEADLGISIINEGEQIRLVLPQMTEENRRNLVKKLNEKLEAAKIRVRHVREEIKEDIEKAFENKEISEDDKFRFLKELNEEVGKINQELKEIREKKENEIMTI